MPGLRRFPRPCVVPPSTTAAPVSAGASVRQDSGDALLKCRQGPRSNSCSSLRKSCGETTAREAFVIVGAPAWPEPRWPSPRAESFDGQATKEAL